MNINMPDYIKEYLFFPTVSHYDDKFKDEVRRITIARGIITASAFCIIAGILLIITLITNSRKIFEVPAVYYGVMYALMVAVMLIYLPVFFRVRKNVPAYERFIPAILFTFACFLLGWCAVLSLLNQLLNGETMLYSYVLAAMSLAVIPFFSPVTLFFIYTSVHIPFIICLGQFQKSRTLLIADCVHMTVVLLISWVIGGILYRSKANDSQNKKRLEKALVEAKNARVEAENASRAKGIFLANMSHEIRTPMNAIIGISDIFGSSELDPDTRKEYTRMLIGSAQSLLTIINDILDYSKIEAGKMSMENIPVDFKQLINDTVQSFSVSSTNSDLSIFCTIGKDIPTNLVCDSVRLRQLISNLISNAVKFTEKGSVQVSVSEINHAGKDITLEISVADTGIGIPKDKVGSLFESFNQLDSSTTRKYGGTGLGLAITKSIVQLMKGTISVESEPGKGSRFICRIPFEVSDAAAKTPDEEVQDQQTYSTGVPFNHLHILIAEDNRVNQEVIKAYLRKMGCSYKFADNGSIALRMLAEYDFDLVLMDVQMPVMDGLEATSLIRKSEEKKGSHIPIIALTAGAMVEDIEKCLKAGMDAHISKPIRPGNLYQVIDRYVKAG